MLMKMLMEMPKPVEDEADGWGVDKYDEDLDMHLKLVEMSLKTIGAVFSDPEEVVENGRCLLFWMANLHLNTNRDVEYLSVMFANYGVKYRMFMDAFGFFIERMLKGIGLEYVPTKAQVEKIFNEYRAIKCIGLPVRRELVWLTTRVIFATFQPS